jgi:hypothetical protein
MSVTTCLTGNESMNVGVAFRCLFESDGTETELADLGPLVAPGELPAKREQWDSQRQGSLQMP